MSNEHNSLTARYEISPKSVYMPLKSANFKFSESIIFETFLNQADKSILLTLPAVPKKSPIYILNSIIAASLS